MNSVARQEKIRGDSLRQANNLVPSWSDLIKTIDAFEDLTFDNKLIDRLQQHHKRQIHSNRILNLHVPSLKKYATSEVTVCNPNAWPAVSITGPECALQCDHCQANVLKPMRPATTPKQLWQQAQSAILGGAKGMLISGGSNKQNEVNFEPFLETIRKIKDRYPHFVLSCHTGLIKENAAKALEQAGMDCAMIDIIGAEDTIRQVYHLRKSVHDFESSLHVLTSTTMKIVPHIVIGLHYGKLLGEWNALEIVRRYAISALVLVVAMPNFAAKHRPFMTPKVATVGRYIADACSALKGTEVMLGCARPPGQAKQIIDVTALCAGIAGIAYHAEGIVELASCLDIPVQIHESCCSIVPDAAMVEKKVVVM